MHRLQDLEGLAFFEARVTLRHIGTTSRISFKNSWSWAIISTPIFSISLGRNNEEHNCFGLRWFGTSNMFQELSDILGMYSGISFKNSESIRLINELVSYFLAFSRQIKGVPPEFRSTVGQNNHNASNPWLVVFQRHRCFRF